MATLPSLPSLTRLDKPYGARAAASQRMCTVATCYPTGLAVTVRGAHPTTRVPTSTASAMWFKELHAGFRSAQGVQFATTPIEDAPLLHAETCELLAASRHPGGAYVDGSMAPRRVAAWLIVSATFRASPLDTLLVDAMAQWADSRVDERRVACRLRMSVAAGSTADALLKLATDGGARNHDPAHPGWRVAVRWCDANGVVQVDVADCHGAPSLVTAVEVVQTAVLALCARHRLAIDGAAAAPVKPLACANAFLVKTALVDAEFARFVECKDSVTLSEAAAHANAAPLESTGVTVRVCERKLEEEGVTSDTAFHGVLLAFDGAREEAAAFANEADPVLSVPLGPAEAAMGLHLCAVHTKPMPLGDAVTLFGLRGRPGEPIHDRLPERKHGVAERAPGRSWVWSEAAAIRPVDGALLSAFNLRPCDKGSLLPTTAELVEPYKEHAARGSKLYLSLRAPHRIAPAHALRRCDSSQNELDAMLDARPTAPPCDDLHAERESAFMVAALNVDLHSRRTTIGEAYHYLFEAGAPAPVRETMLHAMGQLGVRASLSDMFELCSRTIRDHVHVAPELVKDNARLKRLASVCFDALATQDFAAAAKRPVPTPIASNERVRRMLAALNLKRGQSATLPRGAPVSQTCRRVAHVVAQAMHRDAATSNGPEDLAGDAIEQLAASIVDATDDDWAAAVELGIARVAWMETKSHEFDHAHLHGGTPAAGFILSTTVGADTVRVERISNADTPDVFATATTFDALVGCAAPSVLLVQFRGATGTSVTSTVATQPRAG